jgi:hypothetical protein
MPAGPCRTLLPEQRAEVERQLRAMHKVACELATPSLRSFAQHALRAERDDVSTGALKACPQHRYAPSALGHRRP